MGTRRGGSGRNQGRNGRSAADRARRAQAGGVGTGGPPANIEEAGREARQVAEMQQMMANERAARQAVNRQGLAPVDTEVGRVMRQMITSDVRQGDTVRIQMEYDRGRFFGFRIDNVTTGRSGGNVYPTSNASSISEMIADMKRWANRNDLTMQGGGIRDRGGRYR